MSAGADCNHLNVSTINQLEKTATPGLSPGNIIARDSWVPGCIWMRTCLKLPHVSLADLKPVLEQLPSDLLLRCEELVL